MTLFRLTTPMRFMFTFTVKGRDTFPLDMLRRTQSFPNSQEDIYQMIKATGRMAGSVGEDVHIVLAAFSPVKSQAQLERLVKADRWSSFGWTVVSIVGVPCA